MKVDDLNLAIIKELRQGRKSFKSIAQALGVTENTVRTRTRSMEEAGFLKITGLIDVELLPRHQLVLIAVKLRTTDLVGKGEEFSRLRGVVSVSVVTGRYDLFVLVTFNESYGLQEFYTEELPKIEDVQYLETFVVFKSFNMKLPYVL